MPDAYPAGLKVAPLTTWPGEPTPADARKRSPFRATMTDTLDTLDRELYFLGCYNAILEVVIPPGQFRIDGRPRADARAEHPGVVLSLPTTNVGALRYAADRFLTWQDNLRAVALGLEALRKVDRYGITSRHEQYAGFKALDAPAPRDELKDALDFLARAAQWPVRPDVNDPDDVALAYRHAAKLLHPDKGGSTADFQQLEAAMRVIKERGRDV